MGKLAVIEPAEADAEKEREREEWLLKSLFSAVPVQDAQRTALTWERIKGSIPGVLLVPYLDLREEGGTTLTWKRGPHYLDVEISRDGPLDFFYLNAETDEAWDIETAASEKLPDAFLSRLTASFRVVG